MRSAVAQSKGIEDKVEATWDIDDPIFTPRERAALEMASKFTDDYQSVTDEDLARWKHHFDDEELIELGTFMSLADGFGKLVEVLGLGDEGNACKVEV
ncbi:MAG: carboxymuconolactone decarboxylase family protein [Solirubrobacteraceae bacterium]